MSIHSDRDVKALYDELLKKYKIVMVPMCAGWTNDLVLSGGAAFYPTWARLNTGVTAFSRGAIFSTTHGLNSGDRGRVQVDYSKRLELDFDITRYVDCPEAVAHFQLKQVDAQGDLADVGLGVRVDNYTMVGEAYGTARQTVALGTLTDNVVCQIKIVHVPANRVEFWVNRVLTGILTGTAIPTGVLATSRFYGSIINGVLGAINAYFYVGDLKVMQEW